MALQQGYDVTATANAVRFEAAVLLHLVRCARDSSRSPLFIDHEDYYRAYLRRTGLTDAEAPVYMRLPFELGQDILVDFRPERVIQEVLEGTAPELALNVMAWWPDRPGVPSSYRYEDLHAEPRLQVRHDRVHTFRLLDFGDKFLCDEIEGLYGRAVSGVLGLLFDMIGEAQVVRSWTALTPDGWQVARATAKKFFVVTQTVTIVPDGTTHKGLLEDRDGLAELETRLKEPFSVVYAPMQF
jgi:hypothetical protein